MQTLPRPQGAKASGESWRRRSHVGRANIELASAASNPECSPHTRPDAHDAICTICTMPAQDESPYLSPVHRGSLASSASLARPSRLGMRRRARRPSDNTTPPIATPHRRRLEPRTLRAAHSTRLLLFLLLRAQACWPCATAPPCPCRGLGSPCERARGWSSRRERWQAWHGLKGRSRRGGLGRLGWALDDLFAARDPAATVGFAA